MGRSAGARIRADLVALGWPATTPVVAVENAGRTGRRILSGVLDDLPALSERADIQGPTLIITGDAVARADASLAEALAPLVAAA